MSSNLFPNNSPITVEVEGLDQLFEHPSNTALAGSQQSANRVLTLKEACDHYGLGASTIRAKIKSGEIAASKVEGAHGLEWRIFPDRALAGSQQPASTVVIGSQQGQDLQSLLKLVREQAFNLENANKSLQAASFRNGYLEAQLTAKEEEIKLLTDSQHKSSWWLRFKESIFKR
jgi:hypothetical protein